MHCIKNNALYNQSKQQIAKTLNPYQADLFWMGAGNNALEWL